MSQATRESVRKLFTERLGPVGPVLRENEPMRAHTTLQIGGPADWFYQARHAEDVPRALAAAAEAELPVFVLGGGSNLLVRDAGFRGLVLHVACNQVRFDAGAAIATVEAGKDFLEFIYLCRDLERAALEFAAGVPGDIGGAIHGNAGCYGHSISEFVIDGVLAPKDGSPAFTVDTSWFDFDYRESRLKKEQTHVLVESRLRLEPARREEIDAVIEDKLEERRVKHPQWRTEPTAGSYFKNLPPPSPGAHRVPAGRVLDEAHCRGLRVGDAMVFPKHANIIVNAGHATAQEVLTLGEIMKCRAQAISGIWLEEEVLFVGPRPALLAHPELIPAP
ncbi:MAG: UDP-N-acetylmuramate dehydrogenase [Candidatus Eisenbacteria bacterium]